MIEQHDTLLYKLRFLIIGALVAGNVFLLTLILPAAKPETTPATASSAAATATNDTAPAGAYDSPNAVTNGMAQMLDQVERDTASVSQHIDTSVGAVAGAIAGGGRFVHNVVTGTGRFIGTAAVESGMFIARTAQTSVAIAVSAISTTTISAVSAAGAVMGSVSDITPVSAVIKPSDDAAAPAIDPHALPTFATLAAAQTAAPAAATDTQLAAQANGTPAWPLHGEITTFFGVPHWPYQPTHTGLDISSGRPSGAMPIKPFRPGKVIDVDYKPWGLGNNVTVDHGGGITSVYAHLYSIAVTIGQTVDKNTVLGTEGSTGASTGPHLHLEIRVNGTPVDPQQHLAGHP